MSTAEFKSAFALWLTVVALYLFLEMVTPFFQDSFIKSSKKGFIKSNYLE